MKLVSFVVGGNEKIGVLTDEKTVLDLVAGYTLYLRDVEKEERPIALASARVCNNLKEFLRKREHSLGIARACTAYAIEKRWDTKIADEIGRRVIYGVNEVKLNAPIRRPLKIIDVGANTKETREMLGSSINSEVAVWWFLEDPLTVIGPEDAIIHPGKHVTEQLVPENELAIVMGKACGPGISEVREETVDEYVAGYTIFNDVTAIDIASPNKNLKNTLYNLARSKSYPTFSPMGPYLVSGDQLGDASNLKVITRVNGEVKQEANTNLLLRGVRQLVHYFSTCTIMNPGDVIGCGAFAGLPTIWPGDMLELEIEGIGVLRNPVR